MSDDNLIDFAAERGKRAHDLNDKRLVELRHAFEKALPMNMRKKSKKPKKR
jgi:hypothetical protein